MTILYYDERTPKKELYDIAEQLRKVVGKEILVLPKNFDILLNCSIDQLLSIKAIIDTALAEMLQKEQPSTHIESNSKYLN